MCCRVLLTVHWLSILRMRVLQEASVRPGLAATQQAADFKTQGHDAWPKAAWVCKLLHKMLDPGSAPQSSPVGM